MVQPRIVGTNSDETETVECITDADRVLKTPWSLFNALLVSGG